MEKGGKFVKHKSYMNPAYGLAQWLQHPTSLQKVLGLIPVGHQFFLSQAFE